MAATVVTAPIAPIALIDHLAGEMEKLRQAGTYKEELVLQSPQDARVRVGGRDVVMLTSNNYLGFANHPRVREAQKKAIDRWGAGMASVRFICGTEELHKELEAEIAGFFGTDDSVLYMSCWNANEGLFAAILDEPDGLYSDELNHASIIDGVRLCKAKRFRVPHNDMAALERMLTEDTSSRFRLMITDGVFSMEGEEANLREIVRICEEKGALLAVDDSHATGVLGATGRGHRRGAGGVRPHPGDDGDPRKSDGIGGRRIRRRTEGPRRDAAPAEPDVPLLELPAPGGRCRIPRVVPDAARGSGAGPEAARATRSTSGSRSPTRVSAFPTAPTRSCRSSWARPRRRSPWGKRSSTKGSTCRASATPSSRTARHGCGARCPRPTSAPTSTARWRRSGRSGRSSASSPDGDLGERRTRCSEGGRRATASSRFFALRTSRKQSTANAIAARMLPLTRPLRRSRVELRAQVRPLQERRVVPVEDRVADERQEGDQHASERTAGDQPGGVEHPGGELRLLADRALLLLAPPVDERLHHAADPDRRRGGDGQVRADRPGERVRSGELRHERQEDAHENRRPRQVLRQEALDDRGHQRGLRRRELRAADAVELVGAPVGAVEHEERDRDDERGGDDADDEAPLLGFRRRARRGSRSSGPATWRRRSPPRCTRPRRRESATAW